MLRRALVIALGGTGQQVVQRLHERLHLRFGTPTPPEVRFLFVDTDVNNEAMRQFAGSAIQLRVGPDKLRDCQSLASETARRYHLDQWFDPELRARLTEQSFSEGVGGVRMHGRLALLAADTLRTLKERLQTNLQALNRPGQATDLLTIYVVASAGGGTGSGTFLDMGYLTRLVLHNENMSYQTCRHDGILAIAVPTLVDAPQRAANSAALLTELDYFSQDNVFRASYAGEELPEHLGREAPYKYLFLVSPTMGEHVLTADPATAMKQLEQKIADYLFLRLTGPDRVGGLLEDVSKNWDRTETDLEGYPTRFLTFGVGLRQFPAGLCHGVAYRSAVENFAGTWLKPAQRGEAFLDEQALDTRPSVKSQYDADLTTLREILGLPPAHVQETKELRPTGQDALFRELLQTEQQSVVGALRARLQDGRIEDLFQYPGSDAPVGPSLPGYVTGTIRQNTGRLLDPQNDRGVLNRVRKTVWDAAFHLERGPRYALRLVRELNRLMEQEERFMETVLGEMAGDNAESAGKLSVADRVRKDALLLVWTDTAAQRERQRGGGSRVAEARRRLERSLLTGKREIYGAVRAKVLADGENLNQGLKQLAEYVQLWAKEAGADSAEDHRLGRNVSTIPGTVYPKELVDGKVQRLLPAVNPNSLTALRQIAARPEFLRDIPRGDEGRPDFSPFDPVEEEIRQAIRAPGRGPSESIEGESVIRLFSAETDGNVGADARRLVEESRALLNLRLDAVGYHVLVESTPPAFPQPLYHWLYCANDRIDVESHRAYFGAVQDAAREVAGQLKASREEPVHLERSEDGSVAALLFIRGAFPTRIINGYDAERRQRLVSPAQGGRVTTYFSQTGIGIIVDPKEREEAQSLLLLGEALLRDQDVRPHFAWQGDHHQYEYTEGQQKRTLKLPNRRFADATYALAADSGALNSLRIELNRRAQDGMQRGAMAEQIVAQVEALGVLLQAGQTDGYSPDLDLDQMNFQRALSQLVAGAKRLGIILDAGTNRIRPWWASYDSPMRVWRCNKCRHSLGPDQPEVDGHCTHCGYPRQT